MPMRKRLGEGLNSMPSDDSFDPLVWKRTNGLNEWAALTAMCRWLRPRWSVAKCEQALDRIRQRDDASVPTDVARDLLFWLSIHEKWSLLLDACRELERRDIGAAWGLPQVYRDAFLKN